MNREYNPQSVPHPLSVAVFFDPVTERHIRNAIDDLASEFAGVFFTRTGRWTILLERNSRRFAGSATRSTSAYRGSSPSYWPRPSLLHQ